MNQAELIIVGGGVAGAAAALRAAQYHLPCTWVTGTKATQKRSRSAYVMNIDNMIGVHPWLMQDKIVTFLDKEHPSASRELEETHFHISTVDIVDNVRRRIEAGFARWVTFVQEEATATRRLEDDFEITAGECRYRARFLAIATGVMDRQPVIHKRKGERELAGIHWIFPYANEETSLYCIRCEGHFTAGKRVAVVGGGVAAAEIALMLRERYEPVVSILTAGETPSWDAKRGRLLELEGVDVHTGRLVDIRGTQKGAELHGFTLEDDTMLDVDFALVAMGLHRVYNDLPRALGAELEASTEPPERRHVLVNGDSETTVPGLFALGDMTRQRDRSIMKQIYTAQEFAVRAVDTIDRRRRNILREARLVADSR